jgi:hypothetical protein
VDRIEEALQRISEAFDDAPRPSNAELLHEDCYDDMDIVSFYDIAHWREVPDDVVEREYAALSFFSPEGFRHFLPAFLSWVLRHPSSPAAVVDSTIWALTPSVNAPNLQPFALSKFTRLDGPQRAAIVWFLDAMSDHPQAEEGLRHWRPH